MIILAICAHPDDETFAGGTLAKFADEDHAVHLLVTTRGEGGSTGTPPLCEPAQLAVFRERETRASAKVLGARGVALLPYRDPARDARGQLQPIDTSLESFSSAIAAGIAVLKPDVVMTHGSNGEYGHPQHMFTHRAVFAALTLLQPWRPKQVLTWCAAYPAAENERIVNQDDPADLVLDVSPWFSLKVAAMTAHRTQHATFLRYDPSQSLEQVAGRTESFRRWPLYEAEPMNGHRKGE